MSERRDSGRGELRQALLLGGLGIALAVGGTVLALENERSRKEYCFASGQIDDKGLKTPLYNPRTECRILFFEDESGKPRPMDLSGMRW